MESFNYYSNTKQRPGSSINSLHSECVACLKEIELCENELSQLSEQLYDRKLTRIFAFEKMALEIELMKFNRDKLNHLWVRAFSQERLLASFIKSRISPSEQLYQVSLQKLIQEIRDFKETLYDYKNKILLLTEESELVCTV